MGKEELSKERVDLSMLVLFEELSVSISPQSYAGTQGWEAFQYLDTAINLMMFICWSAPFSSSLWLFNKHLNFWEVKKHKTIFSRINEI